MSDNRHSIKQHGSVEKDPRTGANNLVWLAERAGADTSDANTQSFLTRLAVQSAAGAGGDAFQNNQTGAAVAGLSTQEFAFTYAHKVPMPFRSEMGDTTRGITDFIHNRISLGGNLKYMLGIGVAEAIRYSDGEGGGGVTSSVAGFKDPKISHNFGLDIGLSARPVDWLQFGMVARNVNGPKFDIAPVVFNGKRVTKVEVPAQVRMALPCCRSTTSPWPSTSTPRRTRSSPCRASSRGSSHWAPSTRFPSARTSTWRCASAATAMSRGLSRRTGR